MYGSLLANKSRAAFFDAVPQKDTGKAQGVMSILSSLVGIGAPLYGVWLNTSNFSITIPTQLWITINNFVTSLTEAPLKDHALVMGSERMGLVTVPLRRPHFAALHCLALGLIIIFTKSFFKVNKRKKE